MLIIAGHTVFLTSIFKLKYYEIKFIPMIFSVSLYAQKIIFQYKFNTKIQFINLARTMLAVLNQQTIFCKKSQFSTMDCTGCHWVNHESRFQEYNGSPTLRPLSDFSDNWPRYGILRRISNAPWISGSKETSMGDLKSKGNAHGSRHPRASPDVPRWSDSYSAITYLF